MSVFRSWVSKLMLSMCATTTFQRPYTSAGDERLEVNCIMILYFYKYISSTFACSGLKRSFCPILKAWVQSLPSLTKTERSNMLLSSETRLGWPVSSYSLHLTVTALSLCRYVLHRTCSICIHSSWCFLVSNKIQLKTSLVASNREVQCMTIQMYKNLSRTHKPSGWLIQFVAT